MNPAAEAREDRAAAPTYPYPWTPDCGDGTYRNPVIYADYSDPDVIRHGDDFWMTTSSFNCTPGLPILHSRDLVNWALVNHALQNVPGERYEAVQPGCGVWAPALRFHAGQFHLFFPTPDEGIYRVTAEDPRRTWSPPHLVHAGKGLIDPCPLWDDDGNAYLVHAYAHSRSGIKHMLRVRPMAPDGSRPLGEGQVVFHQPERHPTIEGPKFLKRDGWYYILAPAGGVQHGWQTVLRSRSIFGPYEDRIVLEQGRTAVNGPHQGALVDTLNGEWWFLHFQDTGVYGRVVHLQPVEWREGWPLMGRQTAEREVGEPVLHHRKPNLPESRIVIPPTSDEFALPLLGLQWQWQANHRQAWFSLTARGGWLRLFLQSDHPKIGLIPGLLAQKFPAREFAVETLMEFTPREPGAEAGLAILGEADAAIALRYAGRSREVVFRQGGTRQQLGEVPEGGVRLRAEVTDGGSCSLSLISPTGEVITVPTRVQASAGKWVGAKVGIYCVASTAESSNGYADFDYFRFSRL